MGGKRGLSAVVTTLLIILLALVAVGAIWIVVGNLISEGAEDINLARFTLDIAIKSAYVDGSDIRVKIRRSAGEGDIRGLNFVFSDGLNSIVIRRDIILNQLDERTFTFNSTEISGIGAGDEVSVAPIFDSSGSEKIGGITDTEKISSTVPGGGGSGENGESGTGTCGDGIIQSPNGEDPAINELCDLANLNSQTCETLSLGTGTLSCNAGCQFDTSGCSGGTPNSCDGVWNAGSEDPGVVCDGEFKCEANCVCPTGFTADGFGGCSLNSAINTGTINSVWNKIYVDSQDFPKSPVTMSSYIGHSMNFSGSPEIACFLINFGAFVSETNISYVRLDDSLGFPNVAANDDYSIWEAELCGA